MNKFEIKGIVQNLAETNLSFYVGKLKKLIKKLHFCILDNDYNLENLIHKGHIVSVAIKVKPEIIY